MKTLAIFTAALATSLAYAGTASVQTGSITQTISTDALGNQRTVTKRDNDARVRSPEVCTATEFGLVCPVVSV